MKIYKFILLLISVFLLNFIFFKYDVKAEVVYKQITDYKPESSIRAVNGDSVLGSKEMWTYTGNSDDIQQRRADYRKAGEIIAPPGWVYYGGTTTTTILPTTYYYTDAEGYSGTLTRSTTSPYYGWDRYSVMGYNGLDSQGNTKTYIFTKNYPVPGKPNVYYNGCTLKDVGVYSGTVSKIVADPPPPSEPGKPTAIINAPTSVPKGESVNVVGSGVDSGGLSIVAYEWTSSATQLSGTGGNIVVNDTVNLTLKVKNSAGVWSNTVSHTIYTEYVPDPPPPPEPPTAYIFGDNKVVIGEDCAINGYGSDPDGDIENTFLSVSPTYNGVLSGGTGLLWFSNVGFYTATITVIDSTGLSDSASMIIEVIPAYPNVVIEKFGTEKENRKVTLDASNFSTSGSKRFPIDWTKTQWELIQIGSGLTQNEIKTSDSLVGSKSINLLFKKSGQYKAKVTLFNTAGYSNSKEITLNIIKDEIPVAAYNLNTNGLKRDPNDLSPSGLSQATIKVTDNSVSNDGDTIAKRAYIMCFDTNNDGLFDNEQCYIYDLDYVGNTLPFTDSLNAHLRPICLYKDIKSIDITTINTGNFLSFELKTTNVGKFAFEEIVIEEFGQETIEQFVTKEDRKKGDTY